MNSEQNIAAVPWGVRGSFPMTGYCFGEFGGNTSCLSLNFGSDLLIFDAGSGIIRLGSTLDGSQKIDRIHILLSHLHLDHIQGLMGFAPLYESNAQIYLYGANRNGREFKEILSAVISPPYWPVGIKDLKKKVVVLGFDPGDSFNVSDEISVKTAESNHPNGCAMYRVQKGNTSVAYSLDCEYTEEFAAVIEDFARNCSLLVWDSNFTEDDLKPGWGHSTWRQGVLIAKRAGARKVLMTHYNQNYTDDFLKEQEIIASNEFPVCLFAREGEAIHL